jgi:hypothetical protein
MAYRLAGPELLEAVGASLIEGGSLVGGVLVDLAPERLTKFLEPVIFAASIEGTGQIGAWSIRESAGGVGPIYALNGVAREYTDWGAAAGGDSKFEAERGEILKYPEVAEALIAASALVT